jgi:hypothetical protein
MTWIAKQESKFKEILDKDTGGRCCCGGDRLVVRERSLMGTRF